MGEFVGKIPNFVSFRGRIPTFRLGQILRGGAADRSSAPPCKIYPLSEQCVAPGGGGAKNPFLDH